MPKKTQPAPVGVRFPPELLAQIDAHAADTKVTRHAAILGLVKRGFEKVTLPAPPAVILRPKPSRARWNLNGVQLGPTQAALGSRLKGAKKGK